MRRLYLWKKIFTVSNYDDLFSMANWRQISIKSPLKSKSHVLTRNPAFCKTFNANVIIRKGGKIRSKSL